MTSPLLAPFPVVIDRDAAEAFARAVSLDDTRPPTAVADTFPLVWLARPSVIEALEGAPGELPVLVSHAVTVIAPLAVAVPYQVSIFIDRTIANEGRVALNLDIDRADGTPVARHRLVYQLVALAAAAQA
ncbi:MAG: hypothetical protein ACK50Q_05265 [Labrys sp. (in: a-proteobacteria)]